MERLEHHRRERHLVGHAERAVDLHRPRGDVVEHLRHRRLDRRDVAAHPLVVVVLVDLPRRAQHEQPELLDLDPRVGDHRLHQLLAGQQLALRGPRQGPLAHHVEGPLDQPDGAHGVVDAPAAEPGLGDDEALRRARRGGGRRGSRTFVVADVASGCRRRCARTRGRCGRSRHPASRPATTNIDIRLCRGASGSVTASRMRNDGEVGVRREPLLAVDHPLVAVELGPDDELRRVGAALRLGHRVRRHDVVAQQRLEVALLELVRCRSGRGSRRCRSRAPGSRRRSGRCGCARGSR